MFEVLGPCLEMIAATPEALENPVEYGTQLGECIKKLKESRRKKNSASAAH